MKDYFPIGMATGEAFCNRVEERRQLQKNIKKCRHTLISSPRRYGKTSLVHQVLHDLKLPYEKIDLSMITSDTSVRDYIISATERLLVKLQPSYKKAFELAKQVLSHFKPKLILDEEIGAKIELTYHKKENPLQQIRRTLTALDQVAKKSNKRAVLFMDEFQQIATLEHNEAIEAAIRSAAQELKMVTLVFSGSNRKLLLMMFDDRQRPFFQLCEKTFLDRISSNAYHDHLQKLSMIRWNDRLSDQVLHEILLLTERHPYYMNLLCDKVWDSNELPSVDLVKQCWEVCLQAETHLLTQSLISLSHTQRAFLELIITEGITQPTSKRVTGRLNITPRAISKAYHYLMDNDYIYKDADGSYRLINPLLETYIETQIKQKH